MQGACANAFDGVESALERWERCLDPTTLDASRKKRNDAARTKSSGPQPWRTEGPKDDAPLGAERTSLRLRPQIAFIQVGENAMTMDRHARVTDAHLLTVDTDFLPLRTRPGWQVTVLDPRTA